LNRQPKSGFVVAIFFVSGFAALGYEVLWTRYLSLLMASTVHTYVVALTVALTGIVIGSLIAALFFDRIHAKGFVFGALQVLSAIAVVLVMSLPPRVWRGFGESLWIYFVLLLPPAILSGAGFPLAVRLWAGSPADASQGAGRLFAANTVGGILGALITGFVVIPRIGMEGGRPAPH
jgi:spermidine synthase